SMKNMIGKKLKDLRNAYGISQREFGEKVGITKGSINSYENNVNPITQGAKWKILQATGIGFDYFDTDMTLAEAFEKYNINPSKIAFKEIEESICTFYEGVKNYIDGKCLEPFNVKSWVLNHLFGDVGGFDLCFIKVKHNELEPYAKNSEILVVLNNKYAENGDKIIIEYKNTILVVQYFDEFGIIRLKSIGGEEIKLTSDEFTKKVKIVANIKGKYYFEI
ncbi:helix-turn-helix domain-containing protein, partial [Campylobacter jejuni]|nr:helix-turn-helix domain-containing protein [Campylobacter jejuni]